MAKRHELAGVAASSHRNFRARSMGKACVQALEGRMLLAVTAGEYDTIRSSYPEFGLPADMPSVNIIEITAGQLSVANLKSAITAAGSSTLPDLVVLRTTDTQNSITYASSADELLIDIPSSQGAISIVGFGTQPLTLDGANKCRLMTVGGSSTSTTIVNLGGLTLTRGYAQTTGGGAISQLWGTFRLANATMTGNRTSSSLGAGGFFQRYGTSTFRDVAIKWNSAYSSSYGGAGGGVAQFWGDSTFMNVSIWGNSTDDAGVGGGMYLSRGNANLMNVTICGNRAGTGGGVYQYGGTFTLRNTIVAHNTGGSSPDVYRYTGNGAILNGSNNLIGDGSGQGSLVNGSNGNLVGTSARPIDPRFVNMAGTNWRNWDLQLQATSPAVDAGNNAWIPTGITTDIAGGPRINNGTVDMGAYELDQAPANILLSSSTIAENQPVGTVVGSFSIADADAGDTYTYSLVGGVGVTGNGAFQVVGGQLLTAGMFDYETQSSYSIRVRATDQSSLVFERPLTINVTDVNEAPTGIALSNTSVPENEVAGTVVGTLSTGDPDTGDTAAYMLVSGPGADDNSSFTISGNQLLTAASFDYETKKSYSIRVRTTDQGGLVSERAFTISVLDVLEGTIAPWRVGRYGGAVHAVQVVGNRAYVAQGDSLSILDVSTPATPLRLGSINLPDMAYGMSVVGSYAYVADHAAGLQVIDISNPAAPVLVGGYDTSGEACEVSVVGSYAYVADDDAGLQVIDISNPAAPVRVGGYDTSGNANGVSVVGSYAYVADANAGLQVIDISSPAAPVWVGGYDTSGRALGVSVVGSYAYVADSSAGLQVIDISNPAAPVRVGSYDTSGDAWEVSVVGSYAYVADYVAGLQVIDISNPAVPVRVGGCNTSSYSYSCGVSVVGSYAYVADWSAGLVVIDISNPAAPVRVGGYGTSGGARGVSVAGSYAYVADLDADLQVIDISNPAAPVRVGGYDTSNSTCGVSVVGSYAYVASGYGLRVIDISNPAAPVFVGGYSTLGGARGVSVVGSYAYVAAGYGLRVIDISNPAAPVFVGGYDTSGGACGVSVVGSYAYVADYDAGLQVIDISNPAAPVRVGGYDTSGAALGVSVVGSYAYVADWFAGLQVIDISNPAAPARVGGYPTSDCTYDVSVVGSYAYVADYNAGLHVIDISNPAAPVRVGGYDTGGAAVSVSVMGDYAYVADWNGGLQVISITDKAPTDVQLSGASVAENRPAGTAVGSFSTSDPDAGDSFTYTLVSGSGSSDNASFTILGNTLLTTASFNFEAKSSYSIRVRSTDQAGLWFEKVISVTVTNVNETPMDIALSSSSIAENQPVSTAVGTLSTTDPDAGNTFTYSLVSGAGSDDNASFTISGNQLLTAASFNYHTKSSYSILVRTTDQGGLWYEKTFTISVTADTTAPTVTAVYVRGSTWTSGFLSFLAANTAGSSSTYGFAVPVGSGDMQLETLPWRNLNQISIAFSEDVSVAQAQIAIVGSAGSYSVSGFSYSSADHVATWSLSAAMGPDKLYVAVPGSGSAPVTDAAGNLLDGEWNNPSSYSQAGSTDTFPSGDGTAGGDFAFRFDVLPGDSTGGSLGKVNVADVAQTKSRSTLAVSSSSYRSDFDGNNLINVADVAYVKSKSSIYSLPVNPPVLPVFGAVFSQVNPLLSRKYSLLGNA